MKFNDLRVQLANDLIKVENKTKVNNTRALYGKKHTKQILVCLNLCIFCLYVL